MRHLLPLSVLAVLAVSGDAYAQELDVLEQHVAVDLTDPGDLRIQIDLTAEATAATSELWFPYPLVPNATAEVDGAPAQIAVYNGDEALRIQFPAALEQGDSVAISIVLSGPVSCGGGAAFCFHSSSETILTVPQPGSAWFYNNLFTSDPFVGTVEVLAPSSFTVVAGQGAPSSVDAVGDAQRWHFDIDTATELLGLYAGEADQISAEGTPPVTAIYHADQHDPENVALAVDVAAELLPIYSEQYGPLPVDHVHLITAPSDFAAGGMGFLGKVFFNAVVFGSHDYLIEQGVAHELAHSWWGNLATGSAINEAYFLGEGMAEYAAWRGLGASRSSAVRTAGMRMNAVWYQYRRPDDVDVAILAPNVASSPAYVFATYHKGAMVMRALESVVGEAAFGRALTHFHARGIGQLSIAGLIEDVLAESEHDATSFVNQWMRVPGYPYVYVMPTMSSPESELTIEVFGDYDLTLPIRFTFADGSTQDERVTAASGVSVHAFSLPERPAAIAIDPDWTMPREVGAAWPADVNHDAEVDAADLIEVALRVGTYLPTQRRVDGGYDPLYDVDRDREVGQLDLDAVHGAALLDTSAQ